MEVENNVCKIRFAQSGKGTILMSLLGWSGCRRSAMLGCECRLQPAVLPAHEELVKVKGNNYCIIACILYDICLVSNTG